MADRLTIGLDTLDHTKDEFERYLLDNFKRILSENGVYLDEQVEELVNNYIPPEIFQLIDVMRIHVFIKRLGELLIFPREPIAEPERIIRIVNEVREGLDEVLELNHLIHMGEDLEASVESVINLMLDPVDTSIWIRKNLADAYEMVHGGLGDGGAQWFNSWYDDTYDWLLEIYRENLARIPFYGHIEDNLIYLAVATHEAFYELAKSQVDNTIANLMIADEEHLMTIDFTAGDLDRLNLNERVDR